MKTRIVLAAAAWLIAGVSLAEPPAGGQPHGPDMDRMAILLDLNDGQKAEVQKILEAQHDKMRAAHDAKRSADTRPSREEMLKEHEQMKQETVTKLQSVLTADQIRKFEALTDRPPPQHAKAKE